MGNKTSGLTVFRGVALACLLPLSAGFTKTLSASTPVNIKKPIPLEQIISQVRKHHGNIVFYRMYLTEEDRRTVRILDFIDNNQNRQRMVIDAFTGKELELVSLKKPLAIEKSLEKIRTKHQTATILKTWLDQQNGQTVRMVEFIDKQHKRWHTTLDAYTGLIINEHTFNLKPSGKLISLSQMIETAKSRHKSMVVLKTRLTHRQSVKVREIYYLDETGLRKRLVVNAITGEVVEDIIIPALLF